MEHITKLVDVTSARRHAYSKKHSMMRSWHFWEGSTRNQNADERRYQKKLRQSGVMWYHHGIFVPENVLQERDFTDCCNNLEKHTFCHWKFASTNRKPEYPTPFMMTVPAGGTYLTIYAA